MKTDRCWCCAAKGALTTRDGVPWCEKCSGCRYIGDHVVHRSATCPLALKVLRR